MRNHQIQVVHFGKSDVFVVILHLLVNIIGNSNFDHLTKVVSLALCTIKLLLSLLQLTRNLWRDLFTLQIFRSLLDFPLTSFSIHGLFLPESDYYFWWYPNVNYSNIITPSVFYLFTSLPLSVWPCRFLFNFHIIIILYYLYFYSVQFIFKEDFMQPELASEPPVCGLCKS